MKKQQEKSVQKSKETTTLKQAQKDVPSQTVVNSANKVEDKTLKLDKSKKTLDKSSEQPKLENKKLDTKQKPQTQKQKSVPKIQDKNKIQQNKKMSQKNSLVQSSNKSIELNQSKPKDQKQNLTNSNKKQPLPNQKISEKTKPQQAKLLKQELKKGVKQVIQSKDQSSKLNKSKQQVLISSPKKNDKSKPQNSQFQQKLQNKDAKVLQKQSPQKNQIKNQNPSKSMIIQSPTKPQGQPNKDQKNKHNESPAKLQTKKSLPDGKSKETPVKDAKSNKNQSLPKNQNKDSKNGAINPKQLAAKAQISQKIQDNLSKGSGAKINENFKNTNQNQSPDKNQKNQSPGKEQKGKSSKNPPIPQRMVQSASQSPRIKPLNYSSEDIARINFLKRLKKEKESIQQRLQQQKQLQEMQYERIKQEKERQLQRQQSQQKAEKLRKIESRLEEIERRKEQRRRQISERNKEYLQKKTEFTLEHKIINQWLQKELQENKIKEKQLQAKISKMKPINHLQSIKDHIELVESYKQMHKSRFREEDLKFEQSKSRIELEKMYKSNWYKQIQEDDPLKTYKIEQEKKRQEKELLLMKIDNKKKYAEYVKANHKPQNTEESVFKYEKPIIKNFTADQIKKMGLQNLTYCKENVQKHQRKDSKAALSQRSEPKKHKDYLYELKTERKKRENLGSEQDFDQWVQNIKSSTTLTKEQKIKRITILAQKMQKRAQQKQELFNRTNTSRIKILENNRKDSTMVKRESSLPFLKQRSTSQPKLKINDFHKTLLKQKSKANNEDFLKEIDEKLMLLKKI